MIHKNKENFLNTTLLNLIIFSFFAILNQEGVAQDGEDDMLPPVMVISEVANTESSSVTVLSGDVITIGGIQEVRDIQTALPNFSVFDANNTRMPKFSVRGLRENNFGAGQAVIGMYVDGVPYTDMMSRGLSLYDVDVVEFLRGPQGTRFGAGAAPGGVLSISTRQPGSEWGGSSGLGFGDHNTQEYRLNASGPISEQLGVSISGLYNDRDGYITQMSTGSEIDSRETTAGRLQLVFKPSDPWVIRLTGSSERYDDGFMPTYNPSSDVGPNKVNRDFDGYVDSDVDSFALTSDFKGSQFDFSSVTAYRSWEQDLQQDFDFTGIKTLLPPNQLMPRGFYPVIGFSQPDVEQFSQEFRLSSNEGENYSWSLGAYYSDRETDNASGSIFPEGLVNPMAVSNENPSGLVPLDSFNTIARMNDEDSALFWESDFLFGQSVEITTGLRYQNSDRSIKRSSFTASELFGNSIKSSAVGSNDWDAWLPKLGISYAFSQRGSVFANVAKGFQSGGFNFYDGSPDTAQYDSAESWNYEIGWFASWNGGRFNTRAVVFYNDFEDYQVYRLNPMNASEAYMVNAAEANSFGLELEAEAAVSESITLSAALGVINAEFDSYTDNVLRGSDLGQSAAGYEFGGNDINFVPEYTANLAAYIELPWNLYSNIEIQGIGEYWLDEANTAEQDAYALLNARIGYKRNNWELFVYARNLTDENYSNNALDLGGFIVEIPGWERTVGAGFTAKF